ncbi:hypothetical protein J6590_045178 [Homalodisca vitripennis]|nr:hypothetical protein J6590_045178 [Homalodisca vitripennis]
MAVNLDTGFQPLEKIITHSHQYVLTNQIHLFESRFMRSSCACLRAERPGLLIKAVLTLAMLSGVLTVLAGPGGFFFDTVPVVLNFCNVFGLGTVSFRAI